MHKDVRTVDQESRKNKAQLITIAINGGKIATGDGKSSWLWCIPNEKILEKDSAIYEAK